MNLLKVQKMTDLPLSRVLSLNHFPCLHLTLVIGVPSRRPNNVCFIIVHQLLSRVLCCVTLSDYFRPHGLGYQVEAESHSVCIWDTTKIEVYRFPHLHRTTFKLQNVEGISAVCHYAEKKQLYLACETSSIITYSTVHGTMKSQLRLRNEQQIKQMEIHKSKEWLIARTMTNVFVICTKTETVLNSIQLYKVPTIGSLKGFVNSLVGCTSDSKKLAILTQETSGTSKRGQVTHEFSIELYSLIELRNDFRISLQNTPEFISIADNWNSVIWSEKKKMKMFDMKTREVMDLSFESERINAAAIPCSKKCEYCARNSRKKEPKSPKNSADLFSVTIATRDKLKLLTKVRAGDTSFSSHPTNAWGALAPFAS